MRADMKAERVELERRVKEVGMPSEPTTEMTALLEEPDYFGGRNLPSGSRVALTLRSSSRLQSRDLRVSKSLLSSLLIVSSIFSTTTVCSWKHPRVRS